MSITQEQIIKAIKAKKSNQSTADKLGITLEQYLDLRKEYLILTPEQQVKEESIVENIMKNNNLNDTYDVSSGWLKEDGISIQFKKKTEEVDYREDLSVKIDNILKNYKSDYNPIVEKDLLINKNFTNPCVLFISLTDVHIDKQTVENKTLSGAGEKYIEVLNNLLYRSIHSCFVDEIVYVIGNDWFNTDTFYTTTTNQTQQYNNSQWYDSYEFSFDLQVKAINKLKQCCNKLTVIHCPSNHDRTKGFYFAHALEIYFKEDKKIIFNRTAESTKVYTYGENFIGLHHGDTKLENLPIYFASKYYKDWGKCKYHEIGVGDKHHKKTITIGITDSEISGIRVFMTPSMGGFGQWDKTQMYDTSIQAGICRVYDYNKGKCAEFEERL